MPQTGKATPACGELNGRREGDNPPREGSIKLKQAVVWLTGLSGAGKTTLARALGQWLLAAGHQVHVLDGDELRAASPELGFDHGSRHRHILRTASLAADLEDKGAIVVVSLISPYRASRQLAREMCREFIEVYVDTSLEECERRDPKGLYRRARAGQIVNFTGVDDVYEPPEAPEIRIPTAGIAVEQSVKLLVDAIGNRLASR